MIILVEFGDVPKWLKGPHSKCGRSVTPAPEFKSLHLRVGKAIFDRKLSFPLKYEIKSFYIYCFRKEVKNGNFNDERNVF